jgi:hypothetical protein
MSWCPVKQHVSLRWSWISVILLFLSCPGQHSTESRQGKGEQKNISGLVLSPVVLFLPDFREHLRGCAAVLQETLLSSPNDILYSQWIQTPEKAGIGLEYPLHEENPDQENEEELLIDLDDFYDLLMEQQEQM